MDVHDEMGPEQSWGGAAVPRPPFPVTGRQGPAGPGVDAGGGTVFQEERVVGRMGTSSSLL